MTRPNPLRDPEDRRLPRIAGPSGLVLFGVTGDLARKKVMPAIYDLANRGLLPPGFSLVGYARRDWADQDFAQIVHDAVKEHARTEFREEVWKQLSEGFRFVPGDFSDDAAFDQLRRTIEELDQARGTAGNHAFYLSIPPKFFGDVVQQLQEHGLSEGRDDSWRRVVVEKPFGHDLESARELNEVLLETEARLFGGASPRVAPFGDVRSIGALLQRAGFALPVADVETYTVRYESLFGLMKDLRAFGMTNALANRSRRPVSRTFFIEAAKLYAERHADPDHPAGIHPALNQLGGNRHGQHHADAARHQQQPGIEHRMAVEDLEHRRQQRHRRHHHHANDEHEEDRSDEVAVAPHLAIEHRMLAGDHVDGEHP